MLETVPSPSNNQFRTRRWYLLRIRPFDTKSHLVLPLLGDLINVSINTLVSYI